MVEYNAMHPVATTKSKQVDVHGYTHKATSFISGLPQYVPPTADSVQETRSSDEIQTPGFPTFYSMSTRHNVQQCVVITPNIDKNKTNLKRRPSRLTWAHPKPLAITRCLLKLLPGDCHLTLPSTPPRAPTLSKLVPHTLWRKRRCRNPIAEHRKNGQKREALSPEGLSRLSVAGADQWTLADRTRTGNRY